MAEDSPTVHVQNGRVQVFYGLFCGQSTIDRRLGRHLEGRQTPRIASKAPYSVGRASRENRWQVFYPSLHREWATSRVSPGEVYKATYRGSQNQQDRIILCGFSTKSMVHWRCNRGSNPDTDHTQTLVKTTAWGHTQNVGF
jgi:hypothetical protein